MFELLILGLAVNAIYCICKIAHDWRAGRRDWVAAGLFSLLLLYGVVGWSAYHAVRALSSHYAP